MIPMFYGDDNVDFENDADHEAFDKLREMNSVCDVIFEGVEY
jgi:hypothetical protein